MNPNLKWLIEEFGGELLGLFVKHGGNRDAIRRDLVSLLPDIKSDESAIDAELDRQAAEEYSGEGKS